MNWLWFLEVLVTLTAFGYFTAFAETVIDLLSIQTEGNDEEIYYNQRWTDYTGKNPTRTHRERNDRKDAIRSSRNLCSVPMVKENSSDCGANEDHLDRSRLGQELAGVSERHFGLLKNRGRPIASRKNIV